VSIVGEDAVGKGRFRRNSHHGDTETHLKKVKKVTAWWVDCFFPSAFEGTEVAEGTEEYLQTS
jgi:hypothetical protein